MAFSQYCDANPLQDDLDQWLKIKGIGPWTVDYAKMRGQSDSDIWLGSDLGVIKALAKLADHDTVSAFNSQNAKPWRSYLTFQCWSLL
jgi:AraC family transcriptional regulator of adaptative response / DNA-3-methyladenine glycosylase II